MAVSRPDEIAEALWYSGIGRAEIRQENLAPPGADEVRVRAVYGGLSRGTEALVLGGRVPKSEFDQHAIAHHFDETAMVLPDQRSEHIAPPRLEGGERARLVCFHEPAVADHIGGQNCCQTALRRILNHLAVP